MKPFLLYQFPAAAEVAMIKQVIKVLLKYFIGKKDTKIHGIKCVRKKAVIQFAQIRVRVSGIR